MHLIWNFTLIESHPDFAEITLVEGVTAPSLSHTQLPIFIGHLDEFHYVSTEPLIDCQMIFQQQNKQSILKPVEKILSFLKISSQDSHKPGSSRNCRKKCYEYLLNPTRQILLCSGLFWNLHLPFLKTLKHACINSNEFFQIVRKACLYS